MPEIEDIIETTEKAPILLPWQWLALAILCLITIGIILAYRKHKKKSAPEINNLTDSLSKLKEIEQSSIDNNQLTIELSLLTRVYLQSKFKNQSLFQTHQEFISDHQDLKLLPEPAKIKLSTYLSSLADHKYSSPHHLPTEKDKLIHLTEALLRGMDSTSPKDIDKL